MGEAQESRPRFVVGPTTDVPFMYYVVWDVLTQRPVAYSIHWTEAHASAQRFEQNPPRDLSDQP